MTFFISTVVPILHITLSVLLIGAILLQRSEAGLGSSFGGDGFSAGHHERRGFEKIVFYSTIVIAALFAILAVVTLIFH